MSASSAFVNYPSPLASDEEPYSNPPPTNPTLSGYPLSILSSLVANVGPLQQYLWNNANFGCLRALDEAGVLAAYAPRLDPTVAPAPPPSDDPPMPLEHDIPRAHIPFYTCADYTSAYASGRTTPVAVAERLHALLSDSSTNYTIHVPSLSTLLAAAEASEARYKARTPLPLDGVPLLVKDEFSVSSTPLTLGLSHSEAQRRVPAAWTARTSWCVQKLLDAGMLFVGKANMHELGLDTTNNNPHHGTPVNPYDRRYYPGGSSGGSAAAVGAGLVPIAVGADGGGSIRVPSAFCGVYGLKPTHGRVSTAPTVGIAPSVGVAGPIAATAEDLERAYHVLATPDPSSALPFPKSESSLGATRKKKLLGIYKPWFDDCDAAVHALVQAAVDTLVVEHAYEVVSISLPHLPASRTAHALTILTEIGAAFCREDASGLTPANKVLVSVSSRTPARDLLLAQKAREMMMRHLAALWREYPGMLVVSPVTPLVGVRIGKGHDVKGGFGMSDANTSMRSMQYVFLANWTGCPAVSVPVGYVGGEEGEGGEGGGDGEGEGGAKRGMPVGLMAMAEWCGEAQLLELAQEWERAWKGRRRGEGWVDMMAEAERGGSS